MSRLSPNFVPGNVPSVPEFRPHNRIKPWLETDVQEIYISKLELRGDLLWVEDEATRCYQVDLKTKKVRKTKCQ